MESLKAQLQARFGASIIDAQIHRGQLTVEIPYSEVTVMCLALRDESDFAFEQLVDLCGVDYSTWGQGDWQTDKSTSIGFSRGRQQHRPEDAHPELAVVWHLLSLERNQRLRLRAFVCGDPPRIASVTDVWAGADWYERECFDLFGILFEGHPDLRRLLTDYGFIGHPLRKDFPLEGHVEVRYDPDQARVVNQPVSIENRVLVPRVIRDDSRYLKPEDSSKQTGGKTSA
ncbi:MAG: NADH-quinone oxidoreductase subunit C [Candidatus Eutrophobiaceae bacterium]